METRSDGAWTILDVQGEVDLYTAPHLRERLVQLVDEMAYQRSDDVATVTMIKRGTPSPSEP